MFQALCVTTDGPRSEEPNASNTCGQQTLTLTGQLLPAPNISTQHYSLAVPALGEVPTAA